MIEAKDRDRCRVSAQRFARELKAQTSNSGLAFPPSYKASDLQDTDTDGCHVRIATAGGVHVELWLDRFRDTEQRFFWTGFAAKDRKEVEALMQSVPDHLRPARNYSAKDLRYSKNRYLLRKPPSENDMMRPIYERFKGEDISFYGIYDRRTDGSLDYVRAANFIRDVLDSALGDEPYSRTEGGRRHLEVERRTRNSEIALKRKLKDGFRCQVCDFKFQERYGDIGRDFAEAHHLLPLSKLKGETKTALCHLITVCANCHRMLHKMPGNGKKDVDELKRLWVRCMNKRR